MVVVCFLNYMCHRCLSNTHFTNNVVWWVLSIIMLSWFCPSSCLVLLCKSPGSSCCPSETCTKVPTKYKINFKKQTNLLLRRCREHLFLLLHRNKNGWLVSHSWQKFTGMEMVKVMLWVTFYTTRSLTWGEWLFILWSHYSVSITSRKIV